MKKNNFKRAGMIMLARGTDELIIHSASDKPFMRYNISRYGRGWIAVEATQIDYFRPEVGLPETWWLGREIVPIDQIC